MNDHNTQQKHTLWTTYPIVSFILFVMLVCGSMIFQHLYETPPVAQNMRKTTPLPEDKAQKLRALFAQDTRTLLRPVYQPVKKVSFDPLAVPNAHTAMILDVDSGTILYEKNATERRSIASMTKLLTAMIVVERVEDLDAYIVVPEGVLPMEGTTVGCPTSVICNDEQLYAGEHVRISDLLRSALMYSANDAATILGLHVAGSEEAFAKIMNERMHELGATNSHFCRPSGLELDENEEQCYSSAYDIARVMAHMQKHERYDVLWDMMRTKEYHFTNDINTKEHVLKNTNRLLGEMPRMLGAKTGFTPRAGFCLIMASEDPTRKHAIVSVVMDDLHRFDDIETMHAWAFANYDWR